MTNFCRLWGIRAAPSCLLPGLRVIRQGISDPECESAARAQYVTEDMGSGLAGLHMHDYRFA